MGGPKPSGHGLGWAQLVRSTHMHWMILVVVVITVMLIRRPQLMGLGVMEVTETKKKNLNILYITFGLNSQNFQNLTAFIENSIIICVSR